MLMSPFATTFLHNGCADLYFLLVLGSVVPMCNFSMMCNSYPLACLESVLVFELYVVC